MSDPDVCDFCNWYPKLNVMLPLEDSAGNPNGFASVCKGCLVFVLKIDQYGLVQRAFKIHVDEGLVNPTTPFSRHLAAVKFEVKLFFKEWTGDVIRG
jgi:hypothetical protein